MGANASHFSSQPPLDSHDAPVDVAGHVLMARFELEQEIEREVWKIDSVVTELDVCTLYASASHRWGMRTRDEARSFLSSISYDVLTDDDDGTRSDRTDGGPMKPSLERKAVRKHNQRRHRARKKGKLRKASCEHGAAFDRHATTQACLVEAAETVSVDTVLVYDVRRAAGMPPSTLESVLFPSSSAADADALSGFLDRVRERTKAIQAHIHISVPCPPRCEDRKVMQQHLSSELARHLRVPEHRVPTAHVKTTPEGNGTGVYFRLDAPCNPADPAELSAEDVIMQLRRRFSDSFQIFVKGIDGKTMAVNHVEATD